jgi:hypothetical protein
MRVQFLQICENESSENFTNICKPHAVTLLAKHDSNVDRIHCSGRLFVFPSPTSQTKQCLQCLPRAITSSEGNFGPYLICKKGQKSFSCERMRYFIPTILMFKYSKMMLYFQ